MPPDPSPALVKEVPMVPANYVKFHAPTQDDYRAGVCNIGPAEIRRRRRAGHMGLAATIVTFVALLVIGAPQPVRLLVALPAAAAASGYLQAVLHFCAGFGSSGVYNFGPLGTTQGVTDRAERTRDLLMSARIGFGAIAIGAAVGVAAALVPLR